MPAVLVTGASRGIGRACALRFAKEGYDVVINFHASQREAEGVADLVREEGLRALPVRSDVSDPDQAREMISAVEEEFNGLDCLVVNAGLYIRSGFSSYTREQWDRTLKVNLDGAYNCIREALPMMRRREGASMVFITSQLALRGSAHGAPYSASKAALQGLMKSLALELAPGIRVNAVAPGMIDTDLLSGDTPEKRAEREATVPLGRLGTAEDVACAVWFLASRESSYLTGATLHCNGGILMP